MTLAFTEASHKSQSSLHPTTMPEFIWTHGDDLCDCTFQRIGEWTNPYLARTRRVRVCCLEDRMLEGNEDLVQDIPGFFNDNTGLLDTEPLVWDGEDETRVKFEGVEPPKGIPRPKVVDKGKIMSEHEVIGKQLMRIQALEKERNTLVSVIHAIKKGELGIDRIELQDNGFSINDEDDVLSE